MPPSSVLLSRKLLAVMITTGVWSDSKRVKTLAFYVNDKALLNANILYSQETLNEMTKWGSF